MAHSFPENFPDIKGLREGERALAVERYLIGCGLPNHLLNYQPISLKSGRVTGTIYVSPDYIGVGPPDRFIRTPLPARSLQRVADAYGAVLPTARMVYAIHKAPGVLHVGFKGFSPAKGETRDSTRLWLASNADIEKGLSGLGPWDPNRVVTDHKKDVVVGPTQVSRPSKVAIFGGWYPDGDIVQELNVKNHVIEYCDYSQCGRLVKPEVLIGGTLWPMHEVFLHPTYRFLLTGETGALTGQPRYGLKV